MIKKLLPNFLLLAMILVYSACKKDTIHTPGSGTNPGDTGKVVKPGSSAFHLNMPDSLDNNVSVTASLNITATLSSPVVPADFLGFSFEKQIVTDTSYFNTSNTTFINLFKNLDKGLIRIGGATVDRSYWVNGQRNSSVDDSVYMNDVTRYKAFAQSVGWKTIWGLNLGTGTPQNDADEAKYVTQTMGSQISSFAIGNEPTYLYVDGYRTPDYSSDQYLGEFNSFAYAIRNKVPNVMFSGPDNEIGNWGLGFMQNISNQVNMLTLHYYRMGPAGSFGITMDKLMLFDYNLQGLVSAASPVSQLLKLPYRITECNSVYGGGQSDMSNAYASSLWGSEFLFYLAQQGVAGVNFHTGGPARYVYSPINTVNGKSVARPLYYAMLLYHQANIKQFTTNKLTNATNLNMDAYSFVTNDSKKGIMIINKDYFKDLSMTINTTSAVQKATVYQLIGPNLSSLTGVNINGATVNDDGTFAVNGQEFNISGNYSSVLAKVKPTSAMLILLD